MSRFSRYGESSWAPAVPRRGLTGSRTPSRNQTRARIAHGAQRHEAEIALPVATLVPVRASDQQLEVARGRNPRDGSHVVQVLVPEIGSGPGVLDVAVAPFHVGGHTKLHLVVDRQVDEAFDLASVVVPERDIGAKVERPGWQLADHVNIAAERVATKECALRAALHLDPLDVDERIHGLGRTAFVHAVDMEAHGGVVDSADLLGAGASNRRPDVFARASDVDTGRDELQAGHIDRAALLDDFAGKCGNGNRHPLQVFFPPLCGDRDRLDEGDLHRDINRGEAGGDGDLGAIDRPESRELESHVVGASRQRSQAVGSLLVGDGGAESPGSGDGDRHSRDPETLTVSDGSPDAALHLGVRTYAKGQQDDRHEQKPTRHGVDPPRSREETACDGRAHEDLRPVSILRMPEMCNLFIVKLPV